MQKKDKIRGIKMNQVLEQFLREQKRKGKLTPMQEENLQRQFKQWQDAEKQRIREEENQWKLQLDKALAKRVQAEEEMKLHKLKQQEELEQQTYDSVQL